MTAATQTAILRVLFPPAGAVPAERVDSIPPILAHISALEALASGQTEPSRKWIIGAAANQALNIQIAKLRDEECHSWPEIAKQVGLTTEGARHRYERHIAKRAADDHGKVLPIADSRQDLKAEVTIIKNARPEFAPGDHEPAVLQEFIPYDHRDEPIITKEPETAPEPTKPAPPDVSRFGPEGPRLETPVHDLGPKPESTKPQAGPKIPHEYDPLIQEMREKGGKFSVIQETLSGKGITCTKQDVANRYYQNCSKDQPDPKPPQPEQTRNEIDTYISAAHQRGEMVYEIAVAVGRKFKVNMTTGQVAKRIRELERGLA